MKPKSKSVLYIDLQKGEAERKAHEDLFPRLGGWGVAQQLCQEHAGREPLILAIGPLTGAFPLCSPTGFYYRSDPSGLVEHYVGGRLGLVLRLAGLDAVVILGTAAKPLLVEITDRVIFADYLEGTAGSLGDFGLRGRRSRILFGDEGVMVDDTFKITAPPLAEQFRRRNLFGLVVNGTGRLEPADPKTYLETYRAVVGKINQATAVAGEGPSCAGCPLGCQAAGSLGPFPPQAILSRCLIACPAAVGIYEDVATAFSCLAALGYSYTHEDLENLLKEAGQIG